jgi:transposase
MDRGVRLALESGRPVSHVAAELGLPSEGLRKRVRQAEADQGLRPDLPTSAEREEIKELKREVSELRRANEDTTHCPPRGLAGAGAGGAAPSRVGRSLA